MDGTNWKDEEKLSGGVGATAALRVLPSGFRIGARVEIIKGVGIHTLG